MLAPQALFNLVLLTLVLLRPGPIVVCGSTAPSSCLSLHASNSSLYDGFDHAQHFAAESDFGPAPPACVDGSASGPHANPIGKNGGDHRLANSQSGREEEYSAEADRLLRESERQILTFASDMEMSVVHFLDIQLANMYPSSLYSVNEAMDRLGQIWATNFPETEEDYERELREIEMVNDMLDEGMQKLILRLDVIAQVFEELSHLEVGLPVVEVLEDEDQ